jgi:hypothetical protein
MLSYREHLPNIETCHEHAVDARVEDLGPGDFVVVECVCGHSELLTAAMQRTAGVPEYQKILGLQRQMRCWECDERGKATVSVKWTD